VVCLAISKYEEIRQLTRSLSSSLINKLGKVSTDYPSDFAHVFAFTAYNLDYSHEPNFLIRTVLGRLCKVPAVYQELRRLREGYAHSMNADYDDMFGRILAVLDREVAAVQPPEKILVVLDGLDEIPTIQARTRALRQMLCICQVHQQYTNLDFRVILFSREDDQISGYCQAQSGWQRHAIPITDVAFDIRKMLIQRIADHDKMRRWSEEKKEIVVERVKNNSDGMYVTQACTKA
jgi:hypothetical protein